MSLKVQTGLKETWFIDRWQSEEVHCTTYWVISP